VKKRTRIDIYAAILESVSRHPYQGLRLTRISYGAGIPTDRARTFINLLMDAGLVAPNVEDAKYFVTTKHGEKFLKAYYVLKGFLGEIQENIDEL